MALTVSTKSYVPLTQNPDSTVYAGPVHTFSVKDTIEYKRIAAKPDGTFPGFFKPEIKLAKTCTLADGVTKKDAIIKISGSLPVGMVPADLTAMLLDAKDRITAEHSGTTTLFAKGFPLTY